MTKMLCMAALALTLMAPLALPAQAQKAQVAFGNLRQDTSLPVDVSADKLSVDNASGSALFEGNVEVVQGEMRLKAAQVAVRYNEDRSAIAQMHATGGVTIASLGDAAQSNEALYTIDSGIIVMTGDVLLTQGPNVLSGQKFDLNLKTGSGVMEGRVSTTFVPRQK